MEDELDFADALYRDTIHLIMCWMMKGYMNVGRVEEWEGKLLLMFDEPGKENSSSSGGFPLCYCSMPPGGSAITGKTVYLGLGIQG